MIDIDLFIERIDRWFYKDISSVVLIVRMGALAYDHWRSLTTKEPSFGSSPAAQIEPEREADSESEDSALGDSDLASLNASENLSFENDTANQDEEELLEFGSESHDESTSEKLSNLEHMSMYQGQHYEDIDSEDNSEDYLRSELLDSLLPKLEKSMQTENRENLPDGFIVRMALDSGERDPQKSEKADSTSQETSESQPDSASTSAETTTTSSASSSDCVSEPLSTFSRSELMAPEEATPRPQSDLGNRTVRSVSPSISSPTRPLSASLSPRYCSLPSTRSLSSRQSVSSTRRVPPNRPHIYTNAGGSAVYVTPSRTFFGAGPAIAGIEPSEETAPLPPPPQPQEGPVIVKSEDTPEEYGKSLETSLDESDDEEYRQQEFNRYGENLKKMMGISFDYLTIERENKGETSEKKETTAEEQDQPGEPATSSEEHSNVDDRVEHQEESAPSPRCSPVSKKSRSSDSQNSEEP